MLCAANLTSYFSQQTNGQIYIALKGCVAANGGKNICFICSGKNPFEALIYFSWISHLSSSSLLLPYHHLEAPKFKVSIKSQKICDICSRKWTCKIIFLHNTAPISFVFMHFHKIYNLCKWTWCKNPFSLRADKSNLTRDIIFNK